MLPCSRRNPADHPPLRPALPSAVRTVLSGPPYSPQLAPLTPLAAILMSFPASVANKRLTGVLSPLAATLTKNAGVGGLLLTRNPAKDFCPERPSGARDLSCHPAKDFCPKRPSGARDLSCYPAKDFCPKERSDEVSLLRCDEHRYPERAGVRFLWLQPFCVSSRDTTHGRMITLRVLWFFRLTKALRFLRSISERSPYVPRARELVCNESIGTHSATRTAPCCTPKEPR